MNDMDQSPDLSVLICTRNRPKKLRRAVASVLANSLSNFEVIIVDQSTDEMSAQEMEKFADCRIRYLKTSTVGLAISRNIAIRAARADTVIFTDDDCICDSDWLASIQAEYAREPTAVGVYGRVIPYGRRGHLRGSGIGVADDLVCPAVNESTQRLVLDGPVNPHLALGAGNNMSFRKDVFRRVGMFIESLGAGSPMGAGEDTEFSYRLLWYRYKIVYSPAPLVHHDNWLDHIQFAKMMKFAVRGNAAIFLSYVMRFDRTAFLYLIRTAFYLAQNRLAIGSAITGLQYFAMGLALGPKYRVIKPPKLHAAV
jgi:glycosyltransferase involved in cell wall biosynthesis